MKRDDDYMRQLLLDIEASDDWYFHNTLGSADDAEADKSHFHVMLLVDAGFLARFGNDTYRITNAGHDLLALTRRNEAWEATKKAAGHVGGASLQMLLRVAEGLARQKLAELGIPIGQ
jgi:Hypothetical protein (DUF2513).